MPAPVVPSPIPAHEWAVVCGPGDIYRGQKARLAVSTHEVLQCLVRRGDTGYRRSYHILASCWNNFVVVLEDYAPVVSSVGQAREVLAGVLRGGELSLGQQMAEKALTRLSGWAAASALTDVQLFHLVSVTCALRRFYRDTDISSGVGGPEWLPSGGGVWLAPGHGDVRQRPACMVSFAGGVPTMSSIVVDVEGGVVRSRWPAPESSFVRLFPQVESSAWAARRSERRAPPYLMMG